MEAPRRIGEAQRVVDTVATLGTLTNSIRGLMEKLAHRLAKKFLGADG